MIGDRRQDADSLGAMRRHLGDFFENLRIAVIYNGSRDAEGAVILTKEQCHPKDARSQLPHPLY